MTEVPFTEAVAARAGVELSAVEKALLEAGVPTTDEAATPHRLRVTRVRFEGTKAGVHTEPFCFDRSFGAGLWAICTEKNDAGKTSVLEIIMWALRGEPHRPGLPPDVEGWLERIHVEGTLDDLAFTVEFQLTNGVPFGALTYGDESVPFTNEDSFRNIMSDFMLSRLGFFEFTAWDANQGRVTHGWSSCSAALYLRRDSQSAVLGDLATAGVAQRLVLMFVGGRWAQTHVACQTAEKQEQDRVKNAGVTAGRVRSVTAAAIEARNREADDVRQQLGALPADLPDESQITAAHETWTAAISAAGQVRTELATAQLDADDSRRMLTRERKRLQDHTEAALAQRLFHGLQPTTCPRCNVAIGDDRRQAEEHAQTCSICDRQLDFAEDAVAGTAVSAEEADAPFDEEAFRQAVADLASAADADAARATDIARRAQAAEGHRRDAEAAVDRIRERSGVLGQRRALELRLAGLDAVIRELTALGEDPVERAGEPDVPQRLPILQAAAKEAKARVDLNFADVLESVSAAILDLGHRFGFENLQAAKLNLAAQLSLTKGDHPTTFSKCAPGEKLRLRIAVVIALLRATDAYGVGRHPGLLLIDSIGAEETEPGDLAAFVQELAAVTNDLDIETIVASARPEILAHVPEDQQIVARGDEFLW